MGYSPKWAEVTCKIHGRMDDTRPHTREFPQTSCSIGRTKKERRGGGCPLCKQEKKKS